MNTDLKALGAIVNTVTRVFDTPKLISYAHNAVTIHVKVGSSYGKSVDETIHDQADRYNLDLEENDHGYTIRGVQDARNLAAKLSKKIGAESAFQEFERQQQLNNIA